MYNYIENKQTEGLTSNDILTVNGKNVYLADIEKIWQERANDGLVSDEICQICVVQKPEQLVVSVCPGKNINIDSLNSLSLAQSIAAYELEKELRLPLSVSLSDPLGIRENCGKGNDMLTVNGENVCLADIEETWQKLVNRGIASPIGYKVGVLPKSEQLVIKVGIKEGTDIDNIENLLITQRVITDDLKGKLNNIPLSVLLSERRNMHLAEPNAKKVIILQNLVPAKPIEIAKAKLIGENCRGDR